MPDIISIAKEECQMISFPANYYNFSNGLFSSFQKKDKYSLTDQMGDYFSIRSGSYSKLIKAYYKKQSSSAMKEDAQQLIKPLHQMALPVDKTAISSVKVASDQLAESAQALTKEKKEGVTAFVDAYNKMMTASEKSEVTDLKRHVSNMVISTRANQNMLSKVGISIQADNTLKVDEEKLSKANDSDLNVLFEGRYSYADQIRNSAVRLSSSASVKLMETKVYGSNAHFMQMPYTGSFFDSYM